MSFDFIAKKFLAKPLEAKPLLSEEEEQIVCPECEGGGWVLSAYQARGAPNLEECPSCYNPEDLPCP